MSSPSDSATRPADRPLRVAVWSTGAIARHAIEQLLQRERLELVAVRVHDPAKTGREVGELLGLPSTGVHTTDDTDELLAAAPDCVLYAAASPELDATYLPHYRTLLRAGVDVLTVSTPGLVFPPAWHAEAVRSLEDAATAGGATLYASGIEPGFTGDQLVAVLSSLSGTIESIRVQEIFDYDTYENAFMMREVFGFGQPMEHTPLMQLRGSQLHAWGPPVHYVAAALGLRLDEVRETYEREPTPRALDVAIGRLDAGTVGAVRMETIGVAEGREVIVIEHVNRMAPDLAPHWPTADRDGTYRVRIEGRPVITCELTLGANEDQAGEDGMLATAMRLLNAVPAVVAAPPGLTTSLDLPLTTCGS